MDAKKVILVDQALFAGQTAHAAVFRLLNLGGLKCACAQWTARTGLSSTTSRHDRHPALNIAAGTALQKILSPYFVILGRPEIQEQPKLPIQAEVLSPSMLSATPFVLRFFSIWASTLDGQPSHTATILLPW